MLQCLRSITKTQARYNCSTRIVDTKSPSDVYGRVEAKHIEPESVTIEVPNSWEGKIYLTNDQSSCLLNKTTVEVDIFSCQPLASA